MSDLELQHYFHIIIEWVAVMYITICLMLTFIKSPNDNLYKPFRQSKRMITVAFGLMGLNLVVYSILSTGNWSKFNYFIACVDIILFYLEELLLCYSFCHILNNSFLTRRRIAKDCTQIGVTYLLVLVTLVPGIAAYRNVFITLALIVMVENIIELAVLFRKQYKLNGELLDNYFSTDMQRFVHWTSTSITLLIISWAFALTTMFTNVYVNLAFQAYMVSLNIFIAVSFINFTPKYGDIAKAYMPDGNDGKELQQSGAKTAATVDDTTRNTLDSRIRAWVGEKKFIGAQFTIDELAATLGTNKNYLSYFINERYNKNFSAWVSSLRIEEAKLMMAARPEQKLEDIAYLVGFSSPSYFSKVFNLHEGVSPTVWRRKIAKGQ